MKWLLRAGSMGFAFKIMGVIVGACIIGTVWPKADVFHAAWFYALAGILVASLLFCGVRQILSLRRAHGPAAGRIVGSLLLHGGMLAILFGAAIRGVVGQSGSLALHTGETAGVFKTDRGLRQLPFDVTLLRFTIDTHDAPVADLGRILVNWPGSKTPQAVPAEVGVAHTVRPPGAASSDPRSGTVRVVRYVPDFVFDRETRTVATLSDVPNNPAVQVEVVTSGFVATNWAFAKFPGFRMPGLAYAPDPFQLIYETTATPGRGAPIRNFRSTVELAEGGKVVYTGDVAVNAPLAWHGYTLYQSGYNPDHKDWTSLQVVRDPGVPVVFAGFGMLLAGLFIVLFVWPKEPSV